MKKVDRIEAKVKRIYLEKNLLICESPTEEIIAKGEFEDVYPKDEIILYGTYQRNWNWGKYFEVEFYREKYTEFWEAKWMKKTQRLSNYEIAKIVVDKKGIEKIWDDYQEVEKARKILEFLRENGLEEEIIALIEKKYKWNFKILLQNPYEFLKYKEVNYKLVQKIIRKFNCGNPEIEKTKYILENLLLKANQDGHLYLPKKKVKEIFQKNSIKFIEIADESKFIEENEKLYLKTFYSLEKDIAKNIQKRLQTKSKKELEEELVEEWEKEQGFNLAPNQKKAVKMALKENFCVVTGGPGVGKTTVCKCITDLLGIDHDIVMVAPTGRAAKRAKESTGLETSTIHRLLEFNGINFFRNEENPIETDVIVIDESSMVDAPLLLALLRAMPIATKMIFVGDVDQLASVGPGKILSDIIESNEIPVTKLTDIFRQAAGSPIIDCAYKVNEGNLPEIIDHPDLKYIEKTSEINIFKETIEKASQLYKENDFFDVQILLPMYKGPVGIDKVNKTIQNILNPSSPNVKVGMYEIRLGDKVIQTKNDMKRGVYNGDVGIVTLCEKNQIKVRFQGEEEQVIYTREQMNELQLSYAITVHRSQGSEYKYAIIPIAESHGRMLQKNLIYTAITRSKKKLWIIYQLEAFKKAVSLKSVPKRYTSLKDMLKEKSA